MKKMHCAVGTVRAVYHVVVGAIAVVFPVGTVVLFVAGHQVVQRKAVMAGNEPDALLQVPTAVEIEVRARQKPGGEFADGVPIPFDGAPELLGLDPSTLYSRMRKPRSIPSTSNPLWRHFVP